MSLGNVFNVVSVRDLARKATVVLLSSTILMGGGAFAQDFDTVPVTPQDTRAEQGYGAPTPGETWGSRIYRACQGNTDCINDVKVQVGPEISKIQNSAIVQNGQAAKCLEQGINKGNKAYKNYQKQEQRREKAEKRGHNNGSEIGNILGSVGRAMGTMGGFNSCVAKTQNQQLSAIAAQEARIRMDIHKIASKYVKAEKRAEKEEQQNYKTQNQLERDLDKQEQAKLDLCQKQELQELKGKGKVTPACKTILNNAHNLGR